MAQLADTIVRGPAMSAIGRLLSWRELREPTPGFSVIVGAPWDLRHLLPVNLRFIARTDVRELERVHVVFDRTERPGAEELMERCRGEAEGLEIEFHFHPELVGRLTKLVNTTTVYHSVNTVIALRACRSRYAIMHDFDLFPIAPDHFTRIVRAMREKGLRFSGAELTRFDGLTTEDNVIGTWALGIDAEWIRREHRPVECFPKWTSVGERRIKLDPFSHLQLRTPERALAPGDGAAGLCHVNHLCGTCLAFRKGERPKVVWRLHYLWYLESLAEGGVELARVTGAMRAARTSELTVGDYRVDFRNTDATCANVLRSEVEKMELALFGAMRVEAREYVEAFGEFLARFGGVDGGAQSAAARAMTGREVPV